MRGRNEVGLSGWDGPDKRRKNLNPRARSWEARDPQAGELRQAACQHAIVADGHEPRHGHLCDRILRVFVSSRVQIPAAGSMESKLGRSCSLNHARTPRREQCRQDPNSGRAAWGDNRALKNFLRADQGRLRRLNDEPPPQSFRPLQIAQRAPHRGQPTSAMSS